MYGGRVNLLKGFDEVMKFRRAARAGDKILMKELADAKDALNRGALHFTAGDDLINVCKYLVEELKLDINHQDDTNKTPLAFAAEYGRTDIAKYLVEQGAAVQTEVGNSALHRAAANGNIELMKFLIAKGVSVDLRNAYSRTPLVWAASCRRQDAMKFLLEHGANPNGHPEDCMAPLDAAMTGGSVACLDLLIKAGADVDVAVGEANSLHISAYYGRVDFTNYLLEAGANPNAISYLGFSNMDDEDCERNKAIQVAAERRKKQAVKALFPVTTPMDGVQEWSVDGILRHMQIKALFP